MWEKISLSEENDGENPKLGQPQTFQKKNMVKSNIKKPKGCSKKGAGTTPNCNIRNYFGKTLKQKVELLEVSDTHKKGQKIVKSQDQGVTGSPRG